MPPSASSGIRTLLVGAALLGTGCKKSERPVVTSSPSPTAASHQAPSPVDAATVAPSSITTDAAPTYHLPESPESFVDVRDLVPDMLLDMRYAGTNNFAKKIVYPKARCLLRRDVAVALARVQRELRAQGHQLLIWDCYRPFSVQEDFWKLVPDPRYVAQPRRRDGKPFKGSKHNRGAAIDLSVATLDGNEIAMPTDHDDFSERAHWDSPLASEEERSNAALLRQAMEAQGFEGIPTEWWHYDHESWRDYELSDESL